ncbi:DUF4144 domain-containing protein [Pseudoalteromonas sp. OOF1S-7]|uniref:DUF4144 domain-containing protein n=1 Tax=Pseudoalteromonas sp. OOF1S-7 TaxID=2917757 RepID=UPI001EF6AF5A|nr:DUF4144 domain-containing protein [Pseudoalteromonas sp. OOF1S-7]MCG7535625.1 DUF4144 domain-containing protein [Pseudoalteromonas sp. OOF1S-7]
MTIKSYPFLFWLDQSLAYVHSETELAEMCHYTGPDEGICIYRDGRYLTRSGQVVTPLSADELTRLVQQTLVQEGQCCVAKLSQCSVEDAFTLLENIR